MRNGYKLLTALTTTLNNSFSLIEEILKEDKKGFSKNSNHINLALGILSELRDITSNLDENIFILNKHLLDKLQPLITYSNNLFSEQKLVNTCKLYDALKIDVCNLIEFLNYINN